jgi:ribonuclease Z
MEVVVLGSGTPNPDPARAGSAVAVVDGSPWVLVDCGRAATHRALEAGLELAALSAVFLTHHHSDHISDLPTLAMARWTGGATTPLVVIAPVGPSARFARACLDGFEDEAFFSQAWPQCGPRPSIDVVEFAATATPNVVWSGDGWTVSSALVDHHPIEAAVGYRIERGAARIAVSGDTAVCDGIRLLAADVDVLVHETLLEARSRPATLAWNAGAVSVGALAADIRPGVLVLNHLLPAPATPDEEQAFVAEVRTGGFTGTVVVAHDLLRIPLADPA